MYIKHIHIWHAHIDTHTHKYFYVYVGSYVLGNYECICIKLHTEHLTCICLHTCVMHASRQAGRWVGGQVGR